MAPRSRKRFDLTNVMDLIRAEVGRFVDAAMFALREEGFGDVFQQLVRITKEMAGHLPCDFDTITTFRGIGPKCANLALGIACGESAISVDVHVRV